MKVLTNEISINGNNLQEYIDSKIGNLDNLQTQKKDNLINAINEINAKNTGLPNWIGQQSVFTDTNTLTNKLGIVLDSEGNIDVSEFYESDWYGDTHTSLYDVIKMLDQIVFEQMETFLNGDCIGTSTQTSWFGNSGINDMNKRGLIAALGFNNNYRTSGTIENLKTTKQTTIIDAINELVDKNTTMNTNITNLTSWIGDNNVYTSTNTLLKKIGITELDSKGFITKLYTFNGTEDQSYKSSLLDYINYVADYVDWCIINWLDIIAGDYSAGYGFTACFGLNADPNNNNNPTEGDYRKMVLRDDISKYSSNSSNNKLNITYATNYFEVQNAYQYELDNTIGYGVGDYGLPIIIGSQADGFVNSKQINNTMYGSTKNFQHLYGGIQQCYNLTGTIQQTVGNYFYMKGGIVDNIANLYIMLGKNTNKAETQCIFDGDVGNDLLSALGLDDVAFNGESYSYKITSYLGNNIEMSDQDTLFAWIYNNIGKLPDWIGTNIQFSSTNTLIDKLGIKLNSEGYIDTADWSNPELYEETVSSLYEVIKFLNNYVYDVSNHIIYNSTMGTTKQIYQFLSNDTTNYGLITALGIQNDYYKSGLIDALHTQDQSSLVAAINEIVDNQNSSDNEILTQFKNIFDFDKVFSDAGICTDYNGDFSWMTAAINTFRKVVEEDIGAANGTHFLDFINSLEKDKVYITLSKNHIAFKLSHDGVFFVNFQYNNRLFFNANNQTFALPYSLAYRIFGGSYIEDLAAQYQNSLYFTNNEDNIPDMVINENDLYKIQNQINKVSYQHKKIYIIYNDSQFIYPNAFYQNQDLELYNIYGNDYKGVDDMLSIDLRAIIDFSNFQSNCFNTLNIISADQNDLLVINFDNTIISSLTYDTVNTFCQQKTDQFNIMFLNSTLVRFNDQYSLPSDINIFGMINTNFIYQDYNNSSKVYLNIAINSNIVLFNSLFLANYQYSSDYQMTYNNMYFNNNINIIYLKNSVITNNKIKIKQITLDLTTFKYIQVINNDISILNLIYNENLFDSTVPSQPIYLYYNQGFYIYSNSIYSGAYLKNNNIINYNYDYKWTPLYVEDSSWDLTLYYLIKIFSLKDTTDGNMINQGYTIGNINKVNYTDSNKSNINNSNITQNVKNGGNNQFIGFSNDLPTQENKFKTFTLTQYISQYFIQKEE